MIDLRINEPSKRINIIEVDDYQGLNSVKILESDNIEETIDSIKKSMIANMENCYFPEFKNIADVECFIVKLNDGTIVYCIHYSRVIDGVTGENITHKFYDFIRLVCNIPIIS